MAYNGEVRVDVGLSDAQAKKDLRELKREVLKFSESFDAATRAAKKQQSEVERLTGEYKKATKAAEELKIQSAEIAKKAQAPMKASEKVPILREQRKIDADLKAAEESAKSLGGQLKEAGFALNQAQSEAAGFKQQLDDAETKAQELSYELGLTAKITTGIHVVARAAQIAAKIAISAFKKVTAIIGGIAKAAGKAAKGIFGIVKNILTLGTSSRKASGGVNGLFKRLLQLGAAAFVFNVLRKGLNSLSDSIRNLLLANQEFASSWNQIRVNMLTAFAPLWEVLEPAIVSFMQLLAQFTAVLAQFMALLFGKTYTQARLSAKALNDQSKALNGVGSAAKEAGKKLASFDKINQLAQDTSGGGAGADGLDFDFEEPSALAPWLEELADKLKSIFTVVDPEYWFNLGAALAKWIADALNSVPWDKVQEWARVFAINLASFLNGFLGSREMWEAIGHTIAQGLNTALIFLYNFLTTLDFYKIASAIGHGINKFLDEFDWKLLGRTIAAGINGIFDFAAGIIDTVNWADLGQDIADSFTALTDNIKWEEIGTTIKNGVKAILTTIDTALTGYDWGNLGKQFASLLNKALTDKSTWEKLGATLAVGINSAIAVLLKFVKNFNWIEFGTSVGAGINKFVNDINWADAGQLFSDGVKGILNMLNSAIREIDWDDVSTKIREGFANVDWVGIKDAVGESFKGLFKGLGLLLFTAIDEILWSPFRTDAEEQGENVGKGFLLGLLKLAKLFDVTGTMGTVLAAIKKFWGIASPSKVAYELGVFVIQGFASGIKSLIDNVTKLFQDAWNGIQKVWGVTSRWFDEKVITPVRTAFDTALKNIQDIFSKAWDNVSKVWSVVSKWFETNIIEPVKKAFDTALENICGFFNSAWTKIQGVWEVVSGWFDKNVILPVTTAFDGLLKAIKMVFEDAWTGAKTVWDGAKKWFEDTVTEPIKKTFSTAIDSIKGFFSGLWTFISGIFGKIGSLINGVLDKISDVISGAGSASRAASSTSRASGRSADISPALFSPAIGNIEIPRLARGGIVDSATIAMIGEKGREAVVPLQNNTEWMTTLAQEIAGQMRASMPTQSGDRSVNISAEGDIGQLLRFIKFKLEEEDERVGGGFSKVVTT